MMDSIIQNPAIPTNIALFSIIDPNRRVLYSTFPEFRGQVHKKHPSLDSAIKTGQQTSDLIDMPTDKLASWWPKKVQPSVGTSVKLVEIYRPMFASLGDEQDPFGVLKTYHHLDEPGATFAFGTTGNRFMVITSIMAVLFFALLGVVIQGQRFINRGQRSLSQRNKELVNEVTERRQAEEALHSKAEDLSRSNAELEQFAYVASHDLQEPLRAIAGFTKMLARRYRDRSKDDPDDLVTRIVNATNRMQASINDLLSYSRVGGDIEGLQPIECTAVIDEVIGSQRASIDERGAVVTYDPLPTVSGHASILSQVFGNLVDNAIKLRGLEPPRIHVSAERSGNEWVFSVRDNGIGFDLQFADRIFSIFQRLHARDEYPGTGVGLAICKKAVERLGGRIWVESQPGRRCYFLLHPPHPRYRGWGCDHTGVHRDWNPLTWRFGMMDLTRQTGPIEILLVEDNPDDVILTIEALNAGKIWNNLNVAADGVAALDYLKRTGAYAEATVPDIILLDLNLPKKDGRTVLAEIKSDDQLRHIPVVVLTTSQSERDILRSYRLHANCYVTKPVDFDEFTEIVRSIEDFWFTVVKLPRS